MKCVIFQPSYIPWRGFFHQVALADIFIFFDNVQYDKNGWRNRNRIKTNQGTHWLTIPVHIKGVHSNNIPINQIRIDNREPWNIKHWRTISQSYSKAPFFDRYADLLEEYYRRPPKLLAEFTIPLTQLLANWLGIIDTQYLCSSDMVAAGNKTDRLIDLLTQVGATHYISGPSARDYIEKEKFESAGIKLEYMVYEYPPYDQLYPPYDPYVTILDLIFMTGPKALDYILNKISVETPTLY